MLDYSFHLPSARYPEMYGLGVVGEVLQRLEDQLERPDAGSKEPDVGKGEWPIGLRLTRRLSMNLVERGSVAEHGHLVQCLPFLAETPDVLFDDNPHMVRKPRGERLEPANQTAVPDEVVGDFGLGVKLDRLPVVLLQVEDDRQPQPPCSNDRWQSHTDVARDENVQLLTPGNPDDPERPDEVERRCCGQPVVEPRAPEILEPMYSRLLQCFIFSRILGP